MALLSSTQPSLRARVIPRFPAQVIAGQGMTITKAGSVYTFAVTSVITAVGDLPDMSTDRLLGRDAAGSGPPQELTVSNGIGFNGAGGLELTPNQRLRGINFSIDKPGGGPLSAGVVADFRSPYSITLTSMTLLADQTGSVVLDIWKSNFASFPPTVAGSICAAAKPTIVSGIKYSDSTLTGWSTFISIGDVLRLNIDSAATITRLTVNLIGEAI